MTMESFAKRELDALMKAVDPKDEQGVEMQKHMHDNVLEVLEVIGKQGHSGFSIQYFKHLLNRLIDFKPVAPLTGDDDEWVEVQGAEQGVPMEQNKRCPSVFRENKSNDEAYDIDGKLFSYDGGETWVGSKDSRVSITFPYFVPEEPERVIVDNEEDM